MTYFQNLQDLNATGINGVFQVVSTAVPFLPGLILFALFIILSFASFYATQRRIGEGDMAISMSAAGLTCVVVSTIFSFIPNFQNITYLIITIIIEILLVLWMLISRED